MYQHLQRNVLAFTGVQSYDLVDPTAPVPDATLYPTIKAGDRLGIGYDPRNTDLEQEILTAQLDWRFAGQKLRYVGANSNKDLRAIPPPDVAKIGRAAGRERMCQYGYNWVGACGITQNKS